jgi:hypothetical protein
MEAKMKTSMRVTPWDRKALRLEVERIVCGFRENEGPASSLEVERIIQIMNVVPWDPKAIRQEVARIVRGIAGKKEPIYSLK